MRASSENAIFFPFFAPTGAQAVTLFVRRSPPTSELTNE